LTVQTVLRRKGQLTIPAEIREAVHLEEGDPVKIEVVDGAIMLRPCKVVDASQAWFWTPEWQESIRRSVEQLGRGEGREMSDDELLTVLDES
jgi:antitoxin PrlF